MPSHWASLGVAGVCVFAGAWAQPVAESDPVAAGEGQVLYDLDAERALIVGDAYRWSHNEYERTTITWGEGEDAAVESDTYMAYGITANSQVTEVDEDLGVMSVTHLVERLYLHEDELLTPGTVLVATRGEEGTVFSVGGNEIKDELILFVLEEVASLRGKASDEFLDSLNVPEGPQRAGARWEIAGAEFFESMTDISLDVDRVHASGEVHFVGPAEVYGVPGLAIELQFVLDGADPAFEEAYPDWELRQNTWVLEGTLKGPQTDAHFEFGLEMNSRLTQGWHDPGEERDGTVEVYTEVSSGQRELTAHERELLGFE